MKSQKVDKLVSRLPKYIQPSLKLFLSIDLVGSTALKQGADLGFLHSSSVRIHDDQLDQPWLKPIADFYSEFGKIFENEWLLRCDKLAKHKFPTGPDPYFWKANGDELLYVKELKDRRELVSCLSAWIGATKKYREELKLKNPKLDVKCTCWCAGFPITNLEIVFSRVVDPKDDEFVGDPRLRMYCLLKRWHQSESKRKKLSQDFIGPSIDTGFRLTSLATPERMPLSLEATWLYSTSDVLLHKKNKEIRDLICCPEIFYDGSIPLKGVLSGKPYPFFWFDMLTGDKFVDSERDLLPKKRKLSNESISEFCSAFFDKHEGQIIRPFIIGEARKTGAQIPKQYLTALTRLDNKIKDEEARFSGVTKTSGESAAEGYINLDYQPSKSELQDLVKSIIKETKPKRTKR